MASIDVSKIVGNVNEVTADLQDVLSLVEKIDGFYPAAVPYVNKVQAALTWIESVEKQLNV
jgi:hypothetical protein